MEDIYTNLKKGMSSLKSVDASCGIDHIFGGNKVRIASMADLLSFVRIGNDTLVHKAEKDLWRIGDDGKGGMVIERLFDPSSNKPIRV